MLWYKSPHRTKASSTEIKTANYVNGEEQTKFKDQILINYWLENHAQQKAFITKLISK